MFSLMFYGDKNLRVLELRVGLLKFPLYIRYEVADGPKTNFGHDVWGGDQRLNGDF